MGRDRKREREKGPRTLDIDILLFGQHVLSGWDLTLPHPGVKEREFVLTPLLELAPGLRHPRTGLPLRTYLGQLAPQGVYSYTGQVYNWCHLLSAKDEHTR